MIKQCNVCGGEGLYVLNKDGFDLYKCIKCDLVYVYPEPKKEYLKDSVYSYESGYQSHKPKDLSKVPLTKSYKKIFDFIDRKGIKGKMLDVGCSNGEFLYHAKKRGFEVVGIELNTRTAEIAKNNGINVHIGIIDDIVLPENSFDCVFLGDIIEHVPNPKDFLNRCLSLVKKGGYIIISTPNLDCSWSKAGYYLYSIFKIPWSSVTPPYHLFQFSVENLKKLMIDSGLYIDSVWYSGRPSLKYELGSLHLLKRVKNSKGINKIFNGLYMLFSFTTYSITYYFINILKLIRVIKKDFAMVVVGIKK